MAESSKNIKLLIISKSPYGVPSADPRWCYLGMDTKDHRIYRPIPQLDKPKERDFFWANEYNFQVGETHEFKIVPLQDKQRSCMSLPHRNDDIQVTYKRLVEDDRVVDMSDMFEMLKKNASETIEEALGLEVGPFGIETSGSGRPYVEEGEGCSSVGIYKCKSLEALKLSYHNDVVHKLPDDPERKVVVIVELARPLCGREEFNPRRCFLMEAGVIFRK